MPPWGCQGHGTPFCAKPQKRFPCPLAQTGAEQKLLSAFTLSHLANRTRGLGARAGFCPARCSDQDLQRRDQQWGRGSQPDLLPLGQFWTNPCGQVISCLHHALEWAVDTRFHEQDEIEHPFPRALPRQKGGLSLPGFATREQSSRLIRNLSDASCDT